MNDHVSTSRIERFSVSALPEAELDDIARHLGICSSCHQSFAATLRHQRGSAPVTFTLAPEFWLRHEHLDYEQLVEIADNKLDATDREIIDIHLNICPTCKEDVRSFLAFREQLASEMEVSYAPVQHRPQRETYSLADWWRPLVRKPAYAIGVVLLVGIAVATSAVLLKRRTANLQAQKNQGTQTNGTSQSPIPTNNKATVNEPSPSASEVVKGPSRSSPSQGAVNTTGDTTAVASLTDERGEITVDKSGRVTGVDAAPPTTRREIARALLVSSIERPEILKDLAGQDSKLRGSNTDRSFKLLYPARTVIAEDRPKFKWEQLSGASSYRVYVADSNGREVERSADLPPANTAWTATRLKRGEIYTWVVVAVVDSKEIVSPGPARPEVKFQVLPNDSLQELHQLRRTRSHLALGVFYAKVGMIDEAEREFQELVRLNPGSRVATNLLRSVRALRKG